MKRRIKGLIIMCSLLVFYTTMSAVAGEDNLECIIENDEILVREEITEEEFLKAVAEEKGISYEEAQEYVADEHAKNPMLNARAPLYTIRYETLTRTKNIGYGATLVARIKVEVITETTSGRRVGFGTIATKHLTTGGEATLYNYSGSINMRHPSQSIIYMDVLGEIYFDMVTTTEISGGGFVTVGTGVSGTTRYKYLVDTTFTFTP
ncbi:hypothetical protein ABXS75_19555 [Roseburia hominis]